MSLSIAKNINDFTLYSLFDGYISPNIGSTKKNSLNNFSSIKNVYLVAIEGW